MHFAPTAIEGAFEIAIEPSSDDRGFFARVFCEHEFAESGLVTSFPQHSISWNTRKGTVRGMHFSVAPAAETKLVRCTAGHIFDVLVDVRDGSPTFGATQSFELSAGSRKAIYIPAGIAHGFQTLANECEVLYMIDTPYVPSAARGLRWDDPIVSTTWPLPASAISERDRTYPDFIRQGTK